LCLCVFVVTSGPLVAELGIRKGGGVDHPDLAARKM
jgi:hypothetical protein